MPGIEIVANVIDAIRNDLSISELDTSWLIAITALLVALPVMIYPYMNPGKYITGPVQHHSRHRAAGRFAVMVIRHMGASLHHIVVSVYQLSVMELAPTGTGDAPYQCRAGSAVCQAESIDHAPGT